MKLDELLLCLAAFCFYAPAAYAIEIPTGLRKSELAEVTQILGYNTSAKFLSNPYPLGGDSGFEIAFSTEYVNITDLSRLGNGTSRQSDFHYNRISIGKGLFHNLDVFTHFVPFSNSNEVSEYGGSLKWTFYESQYLPFTLSGIFHISIINIEDSFVNETQGADLMAGMNLGNFALYFGIGRLKGRSTFTQNILDLADPDIQLNADQTLIERSTATHSFIGVQVELSSLFVAAQIDRYDQPVYSVKLGWRL